MGVTSPFSFCTRNHSCYVGVPTMLVSIALSALFCPPCHRKGYIMTGHSISLHFMSSNTGTGSSKNNEHCLTFSRLTLPLPTQSPTL